MNIVYYESVILGQQINYFILENKYGVLNKSDNTSRLDKIKKFIKEKLERLVEIVQEAFKKIRYFFFEYIPSKFKKLKDKIIKKNKDNNENKNFETIDLNKLIYGINNIRNKIFDNNDIPSPISVTGDVKKEYEDILKSDFKEKYKDEIYILDTINKTKIKISYKKILEIYDFNKGFTKPFSNSPDKMQKQLESDLYYIKHEIDDVYDNNNDIIENLSIYQKCVEKIILINIC